MRAIDAKLFRELWLMRWQNLAIALVMAAGVATVILSVSTLQSLERTRAQYYASSRFGHVFVHLKRAPLSLVPRLQQIAGVAAIEPRVVMNVTIDVPGLAEPATGRLVSLPEHGAPQVNRLHLLAGRLLEPRRGGEVLISEAFATAHRLRPGDSLTAVINSKQQRLRVVGVALSPEYVYSVRPGELLPDDKRFGVLWMGYEELSSAFDLHGAFNDISVTLQPGATESAVLAQLDNLLAPYGGSNAYGRDQQPSHRFLENELIQLRTMAWLPSAMFLAVTGFLLHVVVSRMVAIQREQIAMMRAFGYTQTEIALRFFLFAFAVAVLGIVLGTFAGAILGSDLTALYSRFFRFPSIHYELDWRLVLITALFSLAAVAGGVWKSVWEAAAKPPAQAMQPESPAQYHPSVVERIGMQQFLPQIARMILRNLERRPARAFLSSLGIALAIGILVMGSFIEDTLDHVMDFQFFTMQRQDILVSFVEPSSGDAARALKNLPGVIAVEPFRAAPARLKHRHHERRIELLGLSGRCQLFRVVDPQRGPTLLPESGLVVSRRLAEILECDVGTFVQVEVMEGLRPVREVPIAAIVDDFLDLNAYMDIHALRRIQREQDTVSGAFLTADSQQLDRLYTELKRTPRVAGVSVKRTAIESYQTTMAENLLRMKALNLVFASIVAVGVVYNCARISLAERSRDLATLRVLGFSKAETSLVLLGELAILVLAAVPLGLVLGYVLAWLLTWSLNTEVHRFPLVINSSTYAFAVIVVVLAALLSALLVQRRIDRFNLVEVLKARD